MELKDLIDKKKKEIAEKGADMSNIDLYNLCVLNRLEEKGEKKNREE